jgi:hypothetical protein
MLKLLIKFVIFLFNKYLVCFQEPGAHNVELERNNLKTMNEVRISFLFKTISFTA